MSKWTKRPQNYCKNCGYLWYPRGKSVSAQCPRCGSAQTTTMAALGCSLFLLPFRWLISLLLWIVKLIAALLKASFQAVVIVLRRLWNKKINLPIGSGYSTPLLVILTVAFLAFCLVCSGCFITYSIADHTLRDLGVLPTYIPIPTETLTATPTGTFTVTPTATETYTLTPTLTPTPTATLNPKTATAVAKMTRTALPTRSTSSSPTPKAPPANTQPPAPTVTPAFTVLVLTSPVQVGGNANVQIQTTANASCFLSYTTPEGTSSDAKGLGATTADSNGICSWIWKIGPGTKPGTGELAIRANGVTRSFDIVIQ